MERTPEDAKEATWRGADCCEAPSDRCAGCERPDDCSGLQGDRNSGAELLQVAHEYGGLKMDQAKRLKELEREKARLKRLVADLSLEKQILKDVAEGIL